MENNYNDGVIFMYNKALEAFIRYHNEISGPHINKKSFEYKEFKKLLDEMCK